MKTFYSFLLVIFCAGFSPKPPTKWLISEAKTGDTVTKMLARFNLDKADCNLRKFLNINDLPDKTKNLKPEKNYKLPIKIVKYNGRSIRTTMMIDDLDRAVRIKLFNEKMRRDELRRDDFTESKNLWIPFHEMDCVDDEPAGTEPEIKFSGKRIFPIFGIKYQKVPLESKKLAGKIFYIVSGHGALDAGAVVKLGKKNLCEDEYAYDVALRLARKLIENGATAYVIVRDLDDGIRDTEICECDFDEMLFGNKTIPASQKPRLFQRSDLVNQLFLQNKKAGLTDQTLVEIHVDSRSKKSSIDVFFYFKPDDETGKRLANHVHKTFALNYLHKRNRAYNGKVSARDLHMLRETKPLSLYVELGNLRNESDQQRILQPENRAALANWLFEGVSTFKK
jgi:N-acetylmuramoyl-L-alanine amidase